jgi:hypothetical protein
MAEYGYKDMPTDIAFYFSFSFLRSKEGEVERS